MPDHDDDSGRSSDPANTGWPPAPTAPTEPTAPPAYGPYGSYAPASPKSRQYGCGALIAAAIGGAVVGVVAVFGLALIFEDALSFDLIVARHDAVGEAGGVEVGDCLEADPADVDVTSRDGVVDCDRSHGAEVMGIVTIPELSGPPSDGRMNDFVTEACALVFRDYVGEDYFSSEKEIGAQPPSDAAWDEGDRSLFCLLDP